MAQTPDRRPGALEEDEEIRLIANPVSPTVSGAFNYDGTNFVFQDALGNFNPRPSGSFWQSTTAGEVFTTGSVKVTGSLTAKLGFSGSLTNLSDGTSYLIAGSNITITSASNGAVTISSTAASTGGEVSASYLVLSATSSLANERVLTPGTGLTGADGGANSSYTLAIDNSVVATVSGTTFTGPVTASVGISLSGSNLLSASLITYVPIDGTTLPHVEGTTFWDSGDKTLSLMTDISGTVLQVGQETYVRVVNKTGSPISNGVVVYLSGTQGNRPTVGLASSLVQRSSDVIGLTTNAIADNQEGFVTIGGVVHDVNTSLYTAGTQLYLSSSPGLFTSSRPSGIEHIVPIGYVVVSHANQGSILVNVGSPDAISDQHDVIDGTPLSGSYLKGDGTYWTRSDFTSDARTAVTGVVADIAAQYLVLSATSSLANERVFTPGAGLSGSDGGSGGNYTLSINDSVVATVSGTTFTGPVVASGGLTGSLQQISAGVPFIVAGPNITINTSSIGQLSITGSASGATGEVSASYLVLSTTASLANERVLTPGTGLTGTDAGANSSYTLAVDNSVVATISGSTFTGPVRFNAGLSGSLTRLADGTSYIQAGSNITVTTGSNGSVTISSTATISGSSGGGGDPGATYIVLSATGSLNNERVLTAGSGITLLDGGAGGNLVISSNTAGVSNGYFSSSFTNANLTGSILPLTHSLGSKYVAVQIFDDSDLLVNPDEIRLVTNNVATVDLSSYGTIPGTWMAVVVAGKGAIQVNVVSKTGNYTAAPGDTILCNTSAGGFTVTLPDATTILNSMVVVKKISTDGNALTIATTASQTIDGSTTLLIQDAWTSVTLVSGPSAWYIV